MPVSDFLPFATALDANVESQSSFVSDPALGPGYSSGMVQSSRVNKLWRQSSFVSAAVARLVMQQLNQDVVDDGDLAGFTSDLTTAIGNIARNVGGGGGSGGIPESPIDGNIYGRGNLAWSQVVPITGATMTGALILASDPTNNFGAATKQYVDNAVALKAPLDSPGFIGTPTTPLATQGANNSQIASTAFVVRAISGITGVTSVTAGAGLTGGGFGSVTLAIVNGGVTNTMHANSPPNTFKGNNQGTAGAPVDMTVNQANTLLGGPFLPLAGGTVTGNTTFSNGRVFSTGYGNPSISITNLADNKTWGMWAGSNALQIGHTDSGGNPGQYHLSFNDAGQAQFFNDVKTVGGGFTVDTTLGTSPNNDAKLYMKNSQRSWSIGVQGTVTGNGQLWIFDNNSAQIAMLIGVNDKVYFPQGAEFNTSDSVNYNVAQGGNARIWFNVTNTRLWSAGVDSSGNFRIADENAGQVRAVIYPSGEFRLWNVFTMAGSAGGSYFQIYDDGNSHLESNTALWLNGNSGKAIYLGGDLNTGNKWIYTETIRVNARAMIAWQAIPASDNTGGVGDPDIAWAQMQCYWYITKSARDKKQDIETAPAGALKQVEALRSVNYRWRQQPMLNPAKGRPEGPSKPHRGFIADEVAEVFGKDWGGYECIEGETGKQEGIAYNELVAVLWSAVQELSAKNTALEHRLLEVEGRM